MEDLEIKLKDDIELIQETLSFLDDFGLEEMPSLAFMQEADSYLCNMINESRFNYEDFREMMNNRAKRKPYNYWKDLNTVINEVNKLKEERAILFKN